MALYKWATGVITPISGVIPLLIAGRGQSCRHFDTSVLSYRDASLQRRVVFTARCISATRAMVEGEEIVTGQIAIITGSPERHFRGILLQNSYKAI